MRVLCLVALFCLTSGLVMDQPENRELMEKPKKHKKHDQKKPGHKKHGHKKYEEMDLDEKMAHGYVLGTMPEHHAKDGDKPVRQRLKSDEGMAYYGTMHVGGQPQVSIYDTGSFDIVLTSSCSEAEEKTITKAKEELMSKSTSSGSSGRNMSDIFAGEVEHFGMKKGEGEGDASGSPFDSIFGDMASQGEKLKDPKVLTCCPKDTCPHADYSSVKSGMNYAEEKDVKLGKITYGSGPVTTRHGSDHVELQDDLMKDKVNGKFFFKAISATSVPIEKIVDHEIDLFKETEMQAIVGIGPGNYKDRKNRMISHLGMKRFMVCFPEDSNEDGFMTWNDKNREKDNAWVTVPVPGKMFWAVPTSEFKLSGTGLMKMFSDVVGCEKSCGGIIDTGTSLITPPAEVVNAIQAAVEKGDVDSCEDISKFPTLQFKLGEHTFSLPPQSYIAETGVQQVLLQHQYLAMPPLPRTAADALKLKAAKDKGETSVQVNSCTLMLSPNEDSEPTQFGPMVIFGMALFRKYAVQFDLSGDIDGQEHNPKKPTRFMRFAEAEHDCSGTGMDQKKRFRRTNTLQKVNLDKIRISPLQQKIIRAPHNKGKNMFRKPILQI